MRHGIDGTTISRIADDAAVSTSTVYTLCKSKEGILRGLMERTLFGPRFEDARAKLDGVTDAVMLIELTPHVSRAIYESESTELGLLRGASAFSPDLRAMEQEFENIRLEMQEERVRLLFTQGRQAPGLSFEQAQRILWMYTSRDVYRMLVQEGSWTPDQYQAWLAETLLDALVDTTDRREQQAGTASIQRHSQQQENQ